MFHFGITSSVELRYMTFLLYWIVKVTFSDVVKNLTLLKRPLESNSLCFADFSGVLYCRFKKVGPGLDHRVLHAEIVQELGLWSLQVFHKPSSLFTKYLAIKMKILKLFNSFIILYSYKMYISEWATDILIWGI